MGELVDDDGEQSLAAVAWRRRRGHLSRFMHWLIQMCCRVWECVEKEGDLTLRPPASQILFNVRDSFIQKYQFGPAELIRHELLRPQPTYKLRCDHIQYVGPRLVPLFSPNTFFSS